MDRDKGQAVKRVDILLEVRDCGITWQFDKPSIQTWPYVKKRVLLKNWVKTHFGVKCSRKVQETCCCHQNIRNSILYNPDVLYFCSKILPSWVNWSICVLPLLRILPFLGKKALKRLRLLWSFFAPQLFEYFLMKNSPNCKNSPKLQKLQNSPKLQHNCPKHTQNIHFADLHNKMLKWDFTQFLRFLLTIFELFTQF